MKKFPLRPYQVTDFQAVSAALRKHDRVLFFAATGYGKTRIAGEFAIAARKQNKRVLFLAPWRELIPQTIDRFTDLGIKAVGVMMSGFTPTPNADVIVGSVETVRRWAPEYDELKEIDFLIADEAHRYGTELRKELLSSWPKSKLLGVTATPFRADRGGLGDVFETLVHGESMTSLIKQGYLVPPTFFSKDPASLTSYRIIEDEATPLAGPKPKTPDAVGDILQEWLALGVGKTLVFANTVPISKALAKKFNDAGITAEHLDSKTPDGEREEILKRFKKGATQVLCNHAVLCEGYDLPDIETVVLNSTQSLMRYLQMVGRGLRASDGKSECRVLDPYGNIFRFGFPHDYRSYSLDGAPTDKPVRLVNGDDDTVGRPGSRPPVHAKGRLEEIDELPNDATSVMRRLEHQAKASGYGMPWAISEFRRLFDGKVPVGKRYREETEAYLRRQAATHGLPVKWAKERTRALFS